MSKLVVPDINIRDYIERRWGVRFILKGKALMGVCPFHSHASTNLNLRVWPESNSYVCSCDQEGGRLFDLITKHEGMPAFGTPGFDETLLHVYSVMGLEPVYRSDAKRDVTDTIYKVYRLLKNHLEPIVFAQENEHYRRDPQREDRFLYRGIDVNTWLSYGVGMLSKDSVQAVVRECGREQLVAAGISPWKTGFDFLTKGVVVLRKSHSGVVVGLKLRFYDMPGFESPHWKNTNHPLLDATSYLFGYHLASQGGNRCARVYVVEGEQDALAFHARGFVSVVCAGKGVLSPEQIEHLMKLEKEIVVVTDNDPNGAGQRNARDMAMKYPGLRFMRMPAVPGPAGQPLKLDPDIFVQMHGVEAFTRLPVDSGRIVRMMSEEMVYDQTGALRWKYPQALLERYYAELITNPGPFMQREQEFMAGLSGTPLPQVQSWVLGYRNQIELARAQQFGAPIAFQAYGLPA
jgi:DNA primase